jgi:hypothetical protein
VRVVFLPHLVDVEGGIEKEIEIQVPLDQMLDWKNIVKMALMTTTVN